MFIHFIDVKLGERAVVLKNGLPLRALAPGRHLVFGRRIGLQRFATDALVFTAPPEVRAVLPRDWYAEVTLAPNERAVIHQDGRPRVFLRSGVQRFWTLDRSVKLERFDVEQPMPALTPELLEVIPGKEYVYAVVGEHQRGLKYVQGRLERVLTPGRYAFWTTPEAQVNVQVLDVRRDQVAITGQELMTRDKVTLRLSLSIEYAVIDPALAAHGVTNVRDALYLMVQLAARQYVAGVTLDELLDSRDKMDQFLIEDAVPKARAFGVHVERVGVKDVVLPGEMKTLLNRVIQAEKEAQANVILRREETAATRSLANTARVMAEHPVLLRLKELEALKEIAERIDEVRVVVGAQGIETLLPAELLGKHARS